MTNEHWHSDCQAGSCTVELLLRGRRDFVTQPLLVHDGNSVGEPPEWSDG